MLGPKATGASAPVISLFGRGLGRNVVGAHDASGNYLPADNPFNAPDDFDGIPIETDRRRPNSFTFPLGRGETVSHRPFSIRAEPLTGGVELQFDVNVFIDVEYIP